MMTPERWQAVGKLFDKALALPPGQRTACIERESGDDDELRNEVLSLLDSHRALPGGFVQEKIKHAVVSFSRANSSQLVSIGPYRIIRELGRGGMGTVFLAEGEDGESSAKVAVKLVRPGMDTEFILARFRRERQTLARMQHPNIARLIDSGTTNDGLPYIVMEYVDGVWITEHVQQRKLGIKARIILFLSVCSAVDYAHRNFVIHRDIKPGNILVDPEDIPKLLDFGICKLLADPFLDSNPETVGRVMMTPGYASPEQVRGEAVTLLSDVYSLGALFYELLTDNPVGMLKRHERLHAAVPLASAMVEHPELKRKLSGDLDCILMRALANDPRRRYESAALFADDLRRYLLKEPVLARTQTFTYRASRIFRRNGGALAVAIMFVSLTSFFAVAWRGIHKKEVPQVNAAVAESDAAQTQNEVARLRDGTTELKEVIASHPHDPSISEQLLRAVASQQLGDQLRRDGDFEEANRAYAESASSAEFNLRSGEPLFLLIFIGSTRKRGLNAIAQGQREEALQLARRALDAGTKATGIESRLAAARGFAAMGVTYAELSRSRLHQTGDEEQAIAWFRKSVGAWHEAQAGGDLHEYQGQEMREAERALAFLEGR
jgi:serine/threonine protein kinase